MMTDKRCGTCRWWRVFHESTGECEAPLPMCVFDWSDRLMRADEGTRCPAWQAQEARDE